MLVYLRHGSGGEDGVYKGGEVWVRLVDVCLMVTASEGYLFW